MTDNGRFDYMNENGGSCGWCGKTVGRSEDAPPEDQATWDHLVPKSLGGLRDGPNGLLACWACNNKRNNAVAGIFAEKVWHNLSMERKAIVLAHWEIRNTYFGIATPSVNTNGWMNAESKKVLGKIWLKGFRTAIEAALENSYSGRRCPCCGSPIERTRIVKHGQFGIDNVPPGARNGELNHCEST